MQTSNPIPTIHEFLYSQGYNDPMPSGVYCVYDVVSDKGYVGSTKDLTFRAGQHFKALEMGAHHNRPLQYLFDADGASAFTFVVLEYCNADKLVEREQIWLNRLQHRAVNKQRTVKRPTATGQGNAVW